MTSGDIMNYKISEVSNGILISGITRFDLESTLDCGQAFRWEQQNGKWTAIAFAKRIYIYSTESGILIEGATLDEFNTIWRNYFDLDRDYDEIVSNISSHDKLKEISDFAGNIRILKQDAWEALCSFIISQNNNIPRIKGIIERLCKAYGEDIGCGYSFPSSETLASLTVDDLAELRSGFRAKYIIDAAQKVASGEVNLEKLSYIPIEDAINELTKIKGVGIKVANCTLLFGCGRIECFPVDVWIKRAMDTLFDGELPEVAVKYAGIVQQYIFHYARMTKLRFD